MKKIVKIELRNYNLKGLLKAIKNNWKIPESTKKEILEFVNDLKIGAITGRLVSNGTISGYLYALKPSLEFFNTKTEKIKLEEVKEFCSKLLKNEIKKVREKDIIIKNKKIKKLVEEEYSNAIKNKIKDTLKKFLEWKLGDDGIVLTKNKMFSAKEKPNKNLDFLTESEVERLYKNCKNNFERYVITVLFDAGLRVEEFYNIRFEDIDLPKNADNFVKITVKEEYSKTCGRTISLYWRHSFGAVRDYINDRTKEDYLTTDLVCEKKLGGIRGFLRTIGNRVLKKDINPHLFRHSSATYYGQKIERQDICYRFGWRFSSPMPDLYINRRGFKNKELDKKFEQTEMSELKDTLKKQEDNLKIKNEEFEKMKKHIKRLQILEQHLYSQQHNKKELGAMQEQYEEAEEDLKKEAKMIKVKIK